MFVLALVLMGVVAMLRPDVVLFVQRFFRHFLSISRPRPLKISCHGIFGGYDSVEQCLSCFYSPVRDDQAVHVGGTVLFLLCLVLLTPSLLHFSIHEIPLLRGFLLLIGLVILNPFSTFVIYLP